MTTMKAIQVKDYGAAGELRLVDAERPVAGAGEVLVRVHAASVNPVDKVLRAGFMKAMVPLSFPWTPGLDVSGVVESVGADVKAFVAGDDVFGKTEVPKCGTYAEYAVVSATGLVKKPRSIDHVHAAAIPLAALTAWQGLFTALELTPGQTVLVLGAAGGVGTFAVQLAKWKGARVVAAGRAAHEAHAKKLGADVFVDTAKGLSAAGQVDAVLDLIGGDVAQKAWAQLKQGGAFASAMGPPSADEAKAKGARAATVFTTTHAQQLSDIAALVDKGTVTSVVSKTLSLASAKEAHELLEARGFVGKIVLTVR